MSSTAAFLISMAALVFIIVLFIVEAVHGNLNIKSKTVGDGQHGTARFSTKTEDSQKFDVIPYEPEKWRQGKHLPDYPDGMTIC